MPKQQVAAPAVRAPRTLEQKLAALKDFETLSAIEAAAKHNVTPATIYDWQKKKQNGELKGAQSLPKQNGMRYPAELKARVIADYRGGTRTAVEVATLHGVEQHLVYKWSSDAKKRSEATSLVRSVQLPLVRTTAMSTGGQTLSFDSPSGESVEIAMLRARNLKLKKIGRALAELLFEEM